MVFRLPAGIYRIKNPGSGTYMSCTPKEQGKIYGWDSDEQDDHQNWELNHIGENYHIRNVGNGRYLSRNGGKGSIIEATSNPTQWSLSRLHSGAWIISSEGLCVDLHEGRNENGTVMHLYHKYDVLYQAWRFKRVRSQPTNGISASLVETNNRLAATEKMVKIQQNELLKMQKFLDAAQERLAAVEKTATEMQQRLYAIDKAMTTNHTQLSAQFDDRTSALETKTGGLESSITRTQSQCSSISKLVDLANDGIDRLDRGSTALQQYNGTLKANIVNVQDRLSTVEEAVNRMECGSGPVSQNGAQPCGSVGGSASDQKSSPPGYPRGNTSFSILEDQRDDPESQAQPIRAMTGDLQKSFIQTQEYLSSVGKYLKTTERKVVALEARTGKQELVNGQLKEEMSAMRISQVIAKESLAGLDGRVQTVESRVDGLTEALGEIRDTEDGGYLPEPPLFPGVFPGPS